MTTVLAIDFQSGIVQRVAFVRVAFRPGYPEVHDGHLSFAAVKRPG